MMMTGASTTYYYLQTHSSDLIDKLSSITIAGFRNGELSNLVLRLLHVTFINTYS
jgi:hypothetical protein